MSRQEILKELNSLERGCKMCTKPPKRAKRDGVIAWCRQNCPVMERFDAIGDQLAAEVEVRKAERKSQQKEKRPSAATPDLGLKSWNDLLATF